MLKRRRTEQDDLLTSGFPSAAAPPPSPAARKRRRRRRGSFLRQIGAAAGLLLLGYATLPFLLSGSRMHPVVEAKLGDAVGRRVRIGSLRFSPTFGTLIATDVAIADDPAFSSAPFLHAQRMEFSLRRIPLIFGGAVEITGVSIEEPTVTLIRNGSQWNFYGLLAAGPIAPDAGPGPALAVRRGLVSLRASDRAEPFVLRDVNLEAPRFSTALENTFALTAVAGGGTLKVNGTWGPLKWLGRSPVAPVNAILNAQKVSLAESTLMSALAPEIGGVLSLAGSVESDGVTAHLKANTQLEKLKLSADGSSEGEPLVLDWVATYDLASGNGIVSRCEAALPRGVAGMTGTFSLAGEHAKVKLQVTAQGAPVTNLSSLLSGAGLPLPPGTSLQGGLVFVDLAVEGDLSGPTTTGSVILNNTKLLNFDLEERLQAVTGLDLLHIERDLPIDEWRSKVRITPGKIALTDLEVDLAGVGTFTGSGEIDANRTLDFRMTALRSGVAEKRPIPFVVRGACVSPIFRQPGKSG